MHVDVCIRMYQAGRDVCVCVFACSRVCVCVCVWISGVEGAGLGAARADGATESRGQLRTLQYVTSTGDCRFVFVRMCMCEYVCVSHSVIEHTRVLVSAASCPDPSPL